jgi:cytochrome c-type biogenesis protein CcmH/NrfF
MTLKPNPEDRQPLRSLKWTLWLPVLAITSGYLLIHRLFVKPKSESELRAAEKARRKQIRRQLRGLTDRPTPSPAKAA